MNVEKIISFKPQAIVIGSGHSGTAVATSLVAAGIRTVWITGETDKKSCPQKDLIKESDLNLETHEALHLSESRSLGGLSNKWGGRLVPFDPVDFVQRDYLGLPGWPIRHEDLLPWFRAAYKFLGVDICHDDDRNFSVIDSSLETGFEVWTNRLKLKQFHKIKSPNLLRVDHYQLYSLHQSTDTGAIQGVTVIHPSSLEKFRLGTRIVVLAAGVTENSRIILLHAKSNPRSFDQTRNLIGTGYTTHINYSHLPLKNPFNLYHFHINNGFRIRTRLSLPETMQQQLAIGNAAGVFSQVADQSEQQDRHENNGSWSARFKRGKQNLIELGSNTKILNFYIQMQIVKRADLDTFNLQSEQIPNSKSFISLGSKYDLFGRQLPNAYVHFSDQDFITVAASIANIQKIISSNSSENNKVDTSKIIEDLESRKTVNTHAHRFGGTIMGSDPSAGLVNQYGEFFELRGLFATGTSIFPTSGQANPTLTNVALSLRTANHIIQNRFLH
jgi:hypothetical protein